jgi:hypothetical protein
MKRTAPATEIQVSDLDENALERTQAAGHDSHLKRLVQRIEAARLAATRQSDAAAVPRRQPYAQD